jgi:hypothetical protein
MQPLNPHSLVTDHAAMLAANALTSHAASAALQSPNVPSSLGMAQNSVTPSQKDFAIALGVSQARISQLVKIGMPLHSIAAAKDWRMKRQRSNDAEVESAETADSPDAAAGETRALHTETVNANLLLTTRCHQPRPRRLLACLLLKYHGIAPLAAASFSRICSRHFAASNLGCKGDSHYKSQCTSRPRIRRANCFSVWTRALR